MKTTETTATASYQGNLVCGYLISNQGYAKRNRNRTVYRWSRFVEEDAQNWGVCMVRGEYVTQANAIRAAKRAGCNVNG